MKKIIMFHGKECHHCHTMGHIADKLIEEGINIEKLEVWHNENNAETMRKFSAIITEACGGDLGVPAFVDEEGNRALCGECTDAQLKEWINKK